LIGVDRPGIGLSTFKRSYRLDDWPVDVAAFARGLGLERFPVVGISSGGPYALACARYLPQVTATGIVSGVGPLDMANPSDYIVKQELQMIGLARRLPLVARLALRFFLWRRRRDPEKALRQLGEELGEADRDVLSRPEAGDWFVANIGELGRQGMRGLVASIAIEGEPWPFALEDVTAPVHLWQGEEDRLCYPAMGHYIADRLPNCRATFCPGEGHLSTVFNRADEIIGTLIGASP
jgi:pimeloyl-ACP methyl ester carboxylesterase